MSGELNGAEGVAMSEALEEIEANKAENADAEEVFDMDDKSGDSDA